MLLECSNTEFGKYADLAYDLALDLSKSGYPTYCDGIKTKDMFMERLLKAFERECEQILLFELEGEVQGLIHYYWIKEDRYLQTNVFNINKATEQALSEFLVYVSERFKGYELFMGFPADNKTAVDYLSAQGFDCIENDYNNTAYLDGLEKETDSDLTRIGRDNFTCFRRLHEQIEGDMYWNSERIYEDLDNWTVLVKEKEGKAQGAVYYRNVDDEWYEIFGTDTDNQEFAPELFKELLTGALSDIKHRKGKVVTFFCDEEYEEVTLECGFKCMGNYLCYKICLD